MTYKNTLDLARQWAADIDADRETLSQDTIDAAADLISSLPDEWVSVDELRKFVADWREGLATAPRGNYEEEMLDDLEDMLPAPPAPRTLADMSPEERAECEWMQCDHPQLEEPGVILHIWGNGCHVVSREGVVEAEALNHVTPRPDLPRLEWPGSEPEETHFDDLPDEVKQVMEDSLEDYKAGRFVDFDTPESASPRPEDVPVGEPWQVEVDGRAAIGYRNDPEHRLCWAVAYRDDASHGWPCDSDVTLIARLVPETTEQDDDHAPPAPEAVAEVVRLRRALEELRDCYRHREARSRERLESVTDEREQFHLARFAHSHKRTHEALARILEGGTDE